jgi:hypothetical protein
MTFSKDAKTTSAGTSNAARPTGKKSALRLILGGAAVRRFDPGPAYEDGFEPLRPSGVHLHFRCSLFTAP